MQRQVGIAVIAHTIPDKAIYEYTAVLSGKETHRIENGHDELTDDDIGKSYVIIYDYQDPLCEVVPQRVLEQALSSISIA